MSAPLSSESAVAPNQIPLSRSYPRSRRQQAATKRASRPSMTVVQALPRPKRPLWLKGLTAMKTLSSGLALGTVGTTLVMYGMTVQADLRLNATTATLQQLQRQEQQLTSAKAVLQHHLTQDAVDGQTEVPSKNVIFLDPEIAPTPSPQGGTAIETTPKISSFSVPLGY